MDIEVILTANDPKLGKRGEVVRVSQGYANNFLIPHGKAKLATAPNLKGFAAEKARTEKEEAERLARAKATAAKIEALSLPIEANAGPEDKLFGSVGTTEIQQALSARGISVERSEIRLEEPVRRLGEFSVPVKLHPSVQATLRVTVVKKA